MKKFKKACVLILAFSLLASLIPTNVYNVSAVAADTTESKSLDVTTLSTEGVVGTEGLVYQCYASVNGRPKCGYVTGYNGTDTDVIIPSTYNGYTIIRVESNAFKNKTHITSVTIPDTVEKIGGNAFNGCSSLKTVYIPDSVTDMSETQMFLDCVQLESITIPDTVTKIGQSMFMRCDNLKTVKLSDQITIIPGQAFYSCDSLESIEIPATVEEIGVNAFASCTSLTKILIPKSVATIGSSAFANCINLTIYCEVAEAQLGWSSSWNYSNLPVIYGREITSISVNSIPTKNRYLKNTDSLDLNGGTIKVDFLSGDSEIIDMEASMISGFSNSIEGMQTLTVTYSGKTVSFDIEIYVDILSDGLCGNEANWKLDCLGQLTISGTGSIYDYEYGSEATNPVPWNGQEDSIKSIVIDDGITEIGSNVFRDLIVDETKIPGGTVIDSSAFQGSQITTLEFVGNKDTENYAIATGTEWSTTSPWCRCERIENVIVNEGIENIGSYAFYGCDTIVKFSIPSTVLELSEDIFDTNNSITISGYYDTAAEQFASLYGLSFVLTSELDKISITEPHKKDYKEGAQLDPTGIILTAFYKNGINITTTNYTVGVLDTTSGEHPVSISYHNLSASVFVNVTPYDGLGTEEEPYLIETKYQLDQVRNYFHSCFKLMNDIEFTAADFNYGDYYNQGTYWNPIGTVAFYGVFDGNGHVIKNLKINVNSSSTVSMGLFKANQGVIKNLGLINCDYVVKTTSSGYAKVGAFAGSNSGEISNCYATGSIETTSAAYIYAAGISAGNTGTISNCYSDVDITANYSYYSTNSYYYPYAAGITASNDAYTTSIEVCGIVRNCYNTGDITVTSTGYYAYAYVGGLVGENRGRIVSSYNAGDLSAVVTGDKPYSYIGGVAAYSGGTIESSYYLDNVEKGMQNDGTPIKCSSAQMILQETFAGFDFNAEWTMEGSNSYLYPKLKGLPVHFVKEAIKIEMNELPNRIAYLETSKEYDLSGGNILVFYTGGSIETRNLTNNMISGHTGNLLDECTVNVGFNGLTTSFNTLIYDYLLGDVNSDEVVDSLDRLTITRYLANWDGYTYDVIDMDAADVNRDGMVDSLDRLIITRHLANWEGYEELAVFSQE